MFVRMNRESVLFYQEGELELQMSLQLKGQLEKLTAAKKPCHRQSLYVMPVLMGPWLQAKSDLLSHCSDGQPGKQDS